MEVGDRETISPFFVSVFAEPGRYGGF